MFDIPFNNLSEIETISPFFEADYRKEIPIDLSFLEDSHTSPPRPLDGRVSPLFEPGFLKKAFPIKARYNQVCRSLGIPFHSLHVEGSTPQTIKNIFTTAEELFETPKSDPLFGEKADQLLTTIQSLEGPLPRWLLSLKAFMILIKDKEQIPAFLQKVFPLLASSEERLSDQVKWTFNLDGSTFTVKFSSSEKMPPLEFSSFKPFFEDLQTFDELQSALILLRKTIPLIKNPIAIGRTVQKILANHIKFLREAPPCLFTFLSKVVPQKFQSEEEAKVWQDILLDLSALSKTDLIPLCESLRGKVSDSLGSALKLSVVALHLHLLEGKEGLKPRIDLLKQISSFEELGHVRTYFKAAGIENPFWFEKTFPILIRREETKALETLLQYEKPKRAFATFQEDYQRTIYQTSSKVMTDSYLSQIFKRVEKEHDPATKRLIALRCYVDFSHKKEGAMIYDKYLSTEAFSLTLTLEQNPSLKQGYKQAIEAQIIYSIQQKEIERVISLLKTHYTLFKNKDFIAEKFAQCFKEFPESQEILVKQIERKFSTLWPDVLEKMGKTPFKMMQYLSSKETLRGKILQKAGENLSGLLEEFPLETIDLCTLCLSSVGDIEKSLLALKCVEISSPAALASAKTLFSVCIANNAALLSTLSKISFSIESIKKWIDLLLSLETLSSEEADLFYEKIEEICHKELLGKLLPYLSQTTREKYLQKVVNEIHRTMHSGKNQARIISLSGSVLTPELFSALCAQKKYKPFTHSYISFLLDNLSDVTSPKERELLASFLAIYFKENAFPSEKGKLFQTYCQLEESWTPYISPLFNEGILSDPIATHLPQNPTLREIKKGLAIVRAIFGKENGSAYPPIFVDWALNTMPIYSIEILKQLLPLLGPKTFATFTNRTIAYGNQITEVRQASEFLSFLLKHVFPLKGSDTFQEVFCKSASIYLSNTSSLEISILELISDHLYQTAFIGDVVRNVELYLQATSLYLTKNCAAESAATKEKEATSLIWDCGNGILNTVSPPLRTAQILLIKLLMERFRCEIQIDPGFVSQTMPILKTHLTRHIEKVRSKKMTFEEEKQWLPILSQLVDLLVAHRNIPTNECSSCASSVNSFLSSFKYLKKDTEPLVSKIVREFHGFRLKTKEMEGRAGLESPWDTFLNMTETFDFLANLLKANPDLSVEQAVEAHDLHFNNQTFQGFVDFLKDQPTEIDLAVRTAQASAFENATNMRLFGEEKSDEPIIPGSLEDVD